MVCRRHDGLGNALHSVNSWSDGSLPHPSHGTAYSRTPWGKRSPRGETTCPEHDTYRHTLLPRVACNFRYKRVKRETVNNWTCTSGTEILISQRSFSGPTQLSIAHVCQVREAMAYNVSFPGSHSLGGASLGMRLTMAIYCHCMVIPLSVTLLHIASMLHDLKRRRKGYRVRAWEQRLIASVLIWGHRILTASPLHHGWCFVLVCDKNNAGVRRLAAVQGCLQDTKMGNETIVKQINEFNMNLILC